ncbi:MAG: PEP-CTERM system TPR-repeat protein PrsT [Burkholderiaceae bacterium]|nr:PEP-CTERM system TPR-repeat protein PrsT [Burkholderiaceae bacterium]
MQNSRVTRSKKSSLRHLAGIAVLFFPFVLAEAAPNTDAARYYQDALGRYEKRDISGAIVQLKSALQHDKSMLPVHVLLGKALLSNGDVVAAEVAFNEALLLGVNRAEVIVPLAQATLAQGKQAFLLEHPRFNPAGLPAAVQVQLYLLRSSALSDLGKPREALSAIEAARTVDASSADVWLAEVPVRIRDEQFSEAMAAVDKALSIAPDSAEAWYQKGAVAHVLGDLAATLAAYDRALRIDATQLEARVARAGLYIDLGRMADAAGDLAELQKSAPKEPRAAYLKALVAEREGNTAAALEGLRQVTALLDPVPLSFIRYQSQLLMLNGLAHFGLNERAKARAYLEEYRKLYANSPASKLLARIYLTESDFVRAVEVLEQYVSTQPNDSQALTLLASAYMAQGSHSRATHLMQQALRVNDAPELRASLGLSLLGSVQPSDAIVELEAAFKQDPKQTQAGSALVGLYLRRGENAKALLVAKQLSKSQPTNPGFLNLLGMAKFRAGDFTGAKSAFEQAIKLDDSMFDAKLNLVRLDIATNAFDAAAARLAVLLKANDKNVPALIEMAALSEKRGQSAEAQRWLQKAVDHSGPHELQAALALVDLHLRNGRMAPALETAEKLAFKEPDNLAALLALSRAQLGNKELRAARTTLTNASRIANDVAPLHVEIANLQLAADNLPGAAYSLEKALHTDPEFLPARALMTEVELRQGELTKAEQRAGQIAQEHPKRAIGHSLLGDIESSRGRAQSAVDAYRRAHRLEPSTETLLRLFRALERNAKAGDRSSHQLAEQWLKAHPKDAGVARALADTYARAGDYQAARAAYEKIVQSQPNDASALNNLAGVLLLVKDPSAMRYAERALALSPTNPQIIDTLGWAAHQAGQTDRALQLLRDARLRDPGNAEIRYHLAAVLAVSGRKSEAREELEAALKKEGDPRFESSKAAEALLRTINQGQ